LSSPMILSSERSFAIQINTLSINKPALSASCLALNSVCKKNVHSLLRWGKKVICNFNVFLEKTQTVKVV